MKDVVVERPSNCWEDIDFIPPSKFYIRNAMGNYLFIRKRKREDAQAIVDGLYGKGHYRICAAHITNTDRSKVTAK